MGEAHAVFYVLSFLLNSSFCIEAWSTGSSLDTGPIYDYYGLICVTSQISKCWDQVPMKDELGLADPNQAQIWHIAIPTILCLLVDSVFLFQSIKS